MTGPVLRVLIADDEPLARLLLRQRLSQCALPATEVVAEAGNAAEVLAALVARPCDLVLLDIRMPGMDGLQLAQRLASSPQCPALVFVTAHSEHALQAFDVAAVDYLTKPVSAVRLQQALLRVMQRLEPPGATALRPAAAGPSAVLPWAVQPAEQGHLIIRERQRSLRLPLAEIVMARAAQKSVTLSTWTREHVLDVSLSELEERLGPAFLRVHRNAIVARHAVRELVHRSEGAPDEGWAVRVVPSGDWVPVSRRMLSAVRQALGAQ